MPSLPVRVDAVLRRVSRQPDAAVPTYQARCCATCSTRSTARASGASLLVNGHGGNDPGRDAVEAWAAEHPDAQALWHNWWSGPRTGRSSTRSTATRSHASWMENFPWTRLAGVAQPDERKPMADISTHARVRSRRRARAARRRLARRPLRAARRRRAARLAGRRRGGSRRCSRTAGEVAPTSAGRVAVVTGTAHGIGAAIARALEGTGRRCTGATRTPST